jgi:catechol 2,3-dioxygenase-like lactoylglutathione lyase family enzyme|tara:strand:- start:490 stop:858 length:369 start_codon:yes stop_codon:yes gene_type:complete
VEREEPPAVGGARLIVSDRAQAEEFFVRIFDAEPGRRIQNDTFDEVFMNVGDGMFVALFEPKGVAPLAKSENPVVAIYSTEFDAVLERVKAGGLRVRERSAGMFLADDPSGNVVEVVRQAAP